MLKRVKAFLKKSYKLSILILAIIFIVCCIAIVVSDLKILAAIPFGFSLICIIRIITYKNGKIPFFSIDKTYQSMRSVYNEDEVEEKFKEKSLNNATVYFIIAAFSFPIWIIAEILNFLLI